MNFYSIERRSILCGEIIPGEIKIASTIKKNLKNLEKILIQTRISIHTTFLDTRVME